MLVHSLRRRKGSISRRLRLLLRRQRLAVGSIEHHWRTSAAVLRVSEMRIGSVCRYESLCLGRNRSEHALLVETDTVAAASILRTFKSRASNLASAAVTTGNSGPLSRSCGLVYNLRLRWRSWLSVDIRRAVGARRRRESVRVLSTLHMRVDGGHVGGRREL
jgi:hypothetical protein